jgi:hypothetical protein
LTGVASELDTEEEDEDEVSGIVRTQYARFFIPTSKLMTRISNVIII